MKKKMTEIINSIKNTIKKINNMFFYGRYKGTYNYINQKSSIKEYIIKLLFIFAIISIFLFLLFNNLIYSIIISFILSIFFLNEMVLNIKKINYETYILSQLSIYTSQVSLLVSYNNIYSSLKEVLEFVEEPIKSDLKEVINSINNGKKINKSFENFNKKYNNRTVTLFNQTLELFDEHGDSDAGTVLQIISEELNMLKIKKDKFLKYKKEWRLNFYVIAILSLVMPLILRAMIPDIYSDFMNSFGTIVMIIVLAINLFVIKKVETIYRDQNIGEGGYR